MRILLIFIFSVLVFNLNANSFQSVKEKPAFREIVWGVCHPFIALKVKRLTRRAMAVSDSLGSAKVLIGKSGGRLDAFKHSFWMAKLAQQIKPRKAKRIGEIHEKVNYRQHQKALKKGKCVQDSTASIMDLKNNDVGIEIGFNNRELKESELIERIIFAVRNGELFIIRKNNQGEFVDCNGKTLKNNDCKWNKGRCLIKSNGEIVYSEN